MHSSKNLTVTADVGTNEREFVGKLEESELNVADVGVPPSLAMPNDLPRSLQEEQLKLYCFYAHFHLPCCRSCAAEVQVNKVHERKW